jgi:hypothetical protein
MRTAAVVLLAATLAGPAAAGGWGRVRPDVDVLVPFDPYQQPNGGQNGGTQWFGGGPHVDIPGTVTIDANPYVCDVDGKQFAKRDQFILHIRVVHHLAPNQIPDALMVVDHRVHFVGLPETAQQGR